MAEVSEPGLLLTLRWRGMDSNFQYAEAVKLVVALLRRLLGPGRRAAVQLVFL